ncbi:MAG: hypothetical protein HY049_04790 [Acidobacteria bacterium]|nr:hypothetical protein [Acidobacteriota bacterium]
MQSLEMSRDEIVAMLEEGARKRLGVSAREFLRLYLSNGLEDIGSVADLISLASLLEENDPILAPE